LPITTPTVPEFPTLTISIMIAIGVTASIAILATVRRRKIFS